MNNQNSGGACVAILSPGDMGHAIGKALIQDNQRVITFLQNRSTRTRQLAEAAGIAGVDSLEQLTLQADLILSILVPDQAIDAAKQIANAARRSGRCPCVADCNAISPQSVQLVEKAITDVGGLFVDASIIGFPPRPGQITRIYSSGPHAHIMRCLDNEMIKVVPIGDRIGQASGIKMCYAAFTKGTFALEFAMLIAAQRLQILDELSAELDFSQTEPFRLMQQQLPRLPAKAHRWVGEMKQIAETFDDLGVPSMFHQAAAEIYQAISQSSLGKETPENINLDRTLAQTILELSATNSP
jgi:3-hydroxyisobutyrate dehydrogenase-like beta-hydroxyacid dehydrogenase